MITGGLPHRVKVLHEKYGPIVRVAPDELSFTDPAAWRDIYPQNFVRPYEYKDKPPGKAAENLISASEPDHARFRKILAPAFSEKSIHEQETMIQGHVDLLICKLHEAINNEPSRTTAVVDILQWLNYTTFDVIGDFIWGSSFNCLDQAQAHPWIQVIAQFKVALIAGAFKFYPPLDTILTLITPKSAMADLWMIWKTTEDKISERLMLKRSRGDIMSYMIAANDSSSENYMSRDEMEINSMLLVIAGSESVTTALLGAIHYLLREPAKLQTLTREVRTAFRSEDNITGISLNTRPYLNAVLQEALRLCPTIPDGMRRQVPKGGASVAGHFLPEGTIVSTPQWATYQSPSNYYQPTAFVPERWLAKSSDRYSLYKDDRKDAFNPFSLGPHNCPGRTLAYLEMRLILAKLVWHFDMEIPQGMDLGKWEGQQIFWFWEKQPTHVKLSNRR
jgi:cytochrome P450